MSERELQNAVIELARLLGYRSATPSPFAPAGNARPPVEADGAGWPDLVLVRDGRLLFVELKSASGVLSPAQEAWKQALERAGSPMYVWRPEDWLTGTVETVLRAGAPVGQAA